jgi:HEAT repeat protein
MNSADIISLLEKPTKDIWPFVYQIRDEGSVSDIVAALRATTNPRTRDLLCYILNLRAGAEFFEGRSSETKQAVPVLIEALDDSDVDVRYAAIDALDHIGDPEAGPALWDMYHKERDDFRLRAVLISALSGCKYAPAIPVLIEALASPHEPLRYAATRGLRYLQAQEAIEPLRKALAQETDSFTQQAMQKALQELEHPVTYEEKIDRLITQLRNAETSRERETAASALADLDKRVLPHLLALLYNEQGEVRQYAIVAIEWLSEHRDADWFVRAYREQVQEPLIRMLADQESKVRAAAAQALGQWGDQRAVEPLLAVIQDTDVGVRRAVVAALRYPKDERALEPLLNAFFTDDDMEVRAYAAEALGRHQQDSRAVNALIESLRDEQSSVRQQAAELLCWLKDERATDALIRALQDNDSEVREWAIEALWQLCIGKGDDLSAEAIAKMREPIMQALQDENSEMRESAEKILEWLD